MSDGQSPVFSISEAASYLKVGKTTFYGILPTLPTLKIGGRTLLTRRALDDYIKRIERAPKKASPLELPRKPGRPRKHTHRTAA